MALSLASNVSHVPAINGLYSFVFSPVIYALLGSCTQMVVGPEAAGSLLVGTVVRSSVDAGRGEDDDDIMQARICGIVTGIAGATVLLAGIARLGFLDSVLSRPFLRGFISAIGFVIFVDQLVPELGLSKLASETASVDHGSTVDKLRFLCSNLDKVHTLTVAVAFVSFTVIMVCREIKRRLQPRYPSVAYVPDRLIVVVLSAYLAWRLEWDKQGVEILGTVKAASGHPFTFRWPFQISHMKHIRDAMSTSFLIALLGFFESSVAAKSLGGQETFAGIQLSANRELIALGVANFVGGCFMSLPAFGGYGRSKVNKSTGGQSPMSSVFLSLITVVAILFLLPYFYYLPKPVLCAMISVVAWSLIEEAPSDISFFLRIHAWPEVGLMLIIVLATIFYSLNLGIAIGIGLSLLQVVRHATRPRIQILGRIPGTNRFENAEDHPERLEFIEGCLIVKIPEPLTFANTGELKTRLRRLELYGTNKAHPALPRLRREEHNRNIVFDIHGVTSMDGSGTQVLEEIVRSYRERGVRVFFSRGPGKTQEVWRLMELSGIIDLIGGENHYVDDVQEALKLTEVEEGSELGVREGDLH
ncbi:sulfate transporter [Niveomyces insectorum RCEF 264]|uniref:Sulfate transporter n=1 Tax=Niveomyces insectorum RCEF 264 TaxID=1081102 RepID=A0A167XMU7_9HYPO|nr:sulfate transporter [Niveomyces insectorum RCEF 264]